MKEKNIWDMLGLYKNDAEDMIRTHPDPFQDSLELKFMLKYAEGKVLNLGCGPGTETKLCSDKTGFAVGLDLSEKMLEYAEKYESERTIFVRGDVRNLSFLRGEFDLFDTVTTRRTFINLSGWAEQKQAIREALSVLKCSGKLILIEASKEGYNELNDLRRKVGLPIIKVVEHNVPIQLSRLERFMDRKCKLIAENSMSTYYFITRLLYPMIESPKYGSRFAKKAEKIQLAIGDIEISSPILLRVYQKRARNQGMEETTN